MGKKKVLVLDPGAAESCAARKQRLESKVVHRFPPGDMKKVMLDDSSASSSKHPGWHDRVVDFSGIPMARITEGPDFCRCFVPPRLLGNRA